PSCARREHLGSDPLGARERTVSNGHRSCDRRSWSAGLTHLLASLLFRVSPRDPWTLVLVAAILAVVALAACYIPARRVTRIDPRSPCGTNRRVVAQFSKQPMRPSALRSRQF